MTSEDELKEAIRTHPCYDEQAHHQFARMHLPVAPHCNIQCNYCNRKFDCSNESRPGVTSEILSPEQAVEKVRFVKEKIPNLKVIGIAGPGDPLANDATFKTLALIKENFPELTLCISTNGLMLPGNEKRLFDLGVRFVTVTVNACDPNIGAEIYDSVLWNGKKYNGKDGAKVLMERQFEGIKNCAKIGIVVKANIVMIPGINDTHIPELVKKVKELGAYIVNILPLIPVNDTKFANRRAPTAEERKELMDKCSIDAKMMRHCRQCRADAIGMLDDDRSGEFAHMGSCKSNCGPLHEIPIRAEFFNNGNKIAVATSDGKTIDSGFGSSVKFNIYDKKDEKFILYKTLIVNTNFEVAGKSHREHLENIVRDLDECDTVIVKEIGALPEKILKNAKKKVIITEGDICDILNTL
jgi:nitrogen fixation protein NifB